MRKAYRKHKAHIDASLFAFLLLAFSIVVNSYAVAYSTKEASNSVTDLILSNIPVFDVDGIYVYGPLVLLIFVIGILAWRPRAIPFVIKSVALFVLVRSVFITLTHIGPFPIHVGVPTTGIVGYFTSLSDLFFSGHTGLPFLLGLIYWDTRWLRYAFIAISVFFGIIVLLGHLHYSIDVLAAFFISYGIYHMAEYLFPADKKRFT